MIADNAFSTYLSTITNHASVTKSYVVAKFTVLAKPAIFAERCGVLERAIIAK
jgi:hypothetical protein